jgi:hypothetical protein
LFGFPFIPPLPPPNTQMLFKSHFPFFICIHADITTQFNCIICLPLLSQKEREREREREREICVCEREKALRIKEGNITHLWERRGRRTRTRTRRDLFNCTCLKCWRFEEKWTLICLIGEV